MKRFKTFAIRSITAGVAALALAGAVHAQTVKVLSIVDHPALDAIRDGVRAELKAEGYGDDKLAGIPERAGQHGHGRADRAQVRRRPARRDRRDRDAGRAGSGGIDEERAGRLFGRDRSGRRAAREGLSGTNVTGVSDKLPLDRQVALIKRVVPNAKTVGMVTTRARQTRSSS